jgi:hypothetical protein
MADRTRLSEVVEAAIIAANLHTDATIREQADATAERLASAGVVLPAPENQCVEFDPSRGYVYLVPNGRTVVEYADCPDKEVAAMAALTEILDPTVLNPEAAARVVAWAHERFGAGEVPV